MNLLPLRIVLTLVIMTCLIRPSIQGKRCGCSQCGDITEDLRRCECCVYLLHGKRSLNKRIFHALETTQTEDNVDVYSLEKRLMPEYLPGKSFDRPLTDKIITSNLLDEDVRSYIHKEPFELTIRDSYNDGKKFLETWRRVLGYVNENDKTEDTYLYLV